MNVRNIFGAKIRADNLAESLVLAVYTEEEFHAKGALKAMDKLENEMKLARVELQAIIDKGNGNE